MIASKPLQLVVFEGSPPSLSLVAERVLRRGGKADFLCVLKPGEDSGPVKRAWMFSVQPLDPGLCLYIIHEPSERAFQGIAEFTSELARSHAVEVNLLYLSDEASWWGSRRLAHGLKELQTSLEKSVPGCVVRRV